MVNGGKDLKKGEDNKKEEVQKDYPCIFYHNIKCPIRTLWKLRPESLAPFCQACKDIYITGKLAKD